MKYDEIHYWSGVKLDIIKEYARSYIKSLSIEPLLGPLPKLNFQDIDWVIVGGESGPGARTMEPSWVLNIRDQYRKSCVPFFFKQWGGFNKKKARRELEGRVWDEMPLAAQRFGVGVRLNRGRN